MGQQLVSDDLADEAIVWFARLKAHDVSARNRLDFMIWLQANEQNQAAFLEILALWDNTTVVKTLDFNEFHELSNSSNLKRTLQSLPK